MESAAVPWIARGDKSPTLGLRGYTKVVIWSCVQKLGEISPNSYGGAAYMDGMSFTVAHIVASVTVGITTRSVGMTGR
jgi:hypothetical protein